MIHKELMTILPTLFELNEEVEIFYLPRINTVDGITEEHIRKWNWRTSIIENQINEKIMDTGSDEYKLLKTGGFIISETKI
jgi:hypothetical protein